MKMKAFMTVLITAVLLQGCIYSDRSGEGRHYRSNNPTLGQELLDLERARANGAINSREYERLKTRLLESGASVQESES